MARSKAKLTFHVGQVVQRLGYDDYARITKLGECWITFQDGRGCRREYVIPLTKAERSVGR